MKDYLASEFYQFTRRKLSVIVLIMGLLLPATVTYLALTSHLNDMLLYNIPIVMNQVIEMIVELTTTLIVSTTPGLLFLIVFVGFNNEIKNRLVINSVSSGVSRSTLYIGKFISILLYALTFMFLAVLGITLVLKFKIDFPILAAAQKYMDYLLPYMLIYLTHILVYLGVLFKFDNPGVAVFAFSLINILPQFLTIFDYVLKPGHWFLKIKPYFFTSLNPMSPVTINGTDITQYLAFAYMILAALVGYAVFKNSELK